MRVCFLATGSELLQGWVHESNSFWLEKKLDTHLGQVEKVVVVPDGLEGISESIQELIPKHDVLVICGGLGPTEDDLGREALAHALGKKLIFKESLWLGIQELFKSRGRVADQSARKQAMTIEGTEVLGNPLGSAPGIKATEKSCTIFSLPGVPSEFKDMSEKYILPLFKKQKFPPFRLRLKDVGESDLMDRMKVLTTPDRIEWGTVASLDGLCLWFSGEGLDSLEWQDYLSEFKKEFRDNIFDEKGRSAFEVMVELIRSKNMKISCAESCTGGMLSKWLTDIPGSSSFFEGAIVAYQNEVKEKILKVPSDILRRDGAVSSACAEAMVAGLLNLFSSELGVSITGIAGPGGGSEEKPVGTIFISVGSKNKTPHTKKFTLHGRREEIRHRACQYASRMVVDYLK